MISVSRRNHVVIKQEKEEETGKSQAGWPEFATDMMVDGAVPASF